MAEGQSDHHEAEKEPRIRRSIFVWRKSMSSEKENEKKRKNALNAGQRQTPPTTTTTAVPQAKDQSSGDLVEMQHYRKENSKKATAQAIQHLRTEYMKVIEEEHEIILQLKEALEIAQAQMKDTEEELEILKEQNIAFQEDLKRTLEEVKKCEEMIAKAGMKSLDEMIQSFEEMKEREKHGKEERAASNQQVSAYKRQVDSLNEQLRTTEEKKHELQEQLNGKEGVLTNYNKLEAQMHSISSALHEKAQAESVLQNEMEKMKNANKVLQQKLRTAWSDVDGLKDENQFLKSQQVLKLQAQDDHPSWLLDMGEVRVLTDEEPIGSGSYGDVRVAMFRGTRVAAKCMHKLILSDYNRKLFNREMDTCASLHHPNIVQFIGAPAEAEYPILLYELMETNLHSLLANDTPFRHPHIVDIGCDVASAMAYIHLWKPHPIIHRDISSSNVLMQSLSKGKWKSKLSDFGAAKLQPHTKTEGPGNPYYAAYEAGDPDNHTPAMDVYSFGVVMMEVTLRCPPEAEQISREEQANGISWSAMKDLILACISKDPTKRLSTLRVLDALKQLM